MFLFFFNDGPNETYLQNRNRLTDIGNRLVAAEGEGMEEGWIGSLGLADANEYMENGKRTKVLLCNTGFFGSCSVAKSCPPLCDPMGCSPPGSSVLRVRILGQVAISFSRGSFWIRD